MKFLKILFRAFKSGRQAIEAGIKETEDYAKRADESLKKFGEHCGKAREILKTCEHQWTGLYCHGEILKCKVCGVLSDCSCQKPATPAPSKG